MNKAFKSCLVIVLILIILVVGLVAAMYFSGFCPPQGPWPMPPWCSPGTAPSIPEVSLEDLENLLPVNPTEQPLPEPYQLPDEYRQLMFGQEWNSAADLPEGFMFGHTFMDVYTTTLYQESLAPTIQAMHNTGANWVVYDNYWSYASFDPLSITPFPDTPGFRNASQDEICRIAEESHQQEMKFALMMELNFDLAMGKFTTWEENQDFWSASQQLLNQKGQDIPTNQDFWDSWFENYGVFALDQAAVAEGCGVDLLVIGKQIDGAVKPGLESYWRELIARVREVYSGPISYAAFTNQYYSQAEDFPIDALDYLTIYLYNDISDLESPTLAELKASFENFNDTQWEPLSRKAGVPVIFLTPFQSRDYGAQQVWFEPAAPAPDVQEDLLIQAKLYQAFFQALEDEDWVAGVFTWGFWWRDDFNRLWEPEDASFNKSSSVRNKPAEWIFRSWAQGLP